MHSLCNVSHDNRFLFSFSLETHSQRFKETTAPWACGFLTDRSADRNTCTKQRGDALQKAVYTLLHSSLQHGGEILAGDATNYFPLLPIVHEQLPKSWEKRAAAPQCHSTLDLPILQFQCIWKGKSRQKSGSLRTGSSGRGIVLKRLFSAQPFWRFQTSNMGMAVQTVVKPVRNISITGIPQPDWQ